MTLLFSLELRTQQEVLVKTSISEILRAVTERRSKQWALLLLVLTALSFVGSLVLIGLVCRPSTSLVTTPTTSPSPSVASALSPTQPVPPSWLSWVVSPRVKEKTGCLYPFSMVTRGLSRVEVFVVGANVTVVTPTLTRVGKTSTSPNNTEELFELSSGSKVMTRRLMGLRVDTLTRVITFVSETTETFRNDNICDTEIVV